MQRLHLLGQRTEGFLHREGRNHEAIGSDAEQDAVDNGKRQRQLDRERRPLAARRLNVDASAQRLDVAPHDVHADAAARQLGHSRGRQKPGWKIS